MGVIFQILKIFENLYRERNENITFYNKAEFTKEGTFFTDRFPFLRTFVDKKVGI